MVTYVVSRGAETNALVTSVVTVVTWPRGWRWGLGVTWWRESNGWMMDGLVVVYVYIYGMVYIYELCMLIYLNICVYIFWIYRCTHIYPCIYIHIHIWKYLRSFGEDEAIMTNILSDGWLNHQLVIFCCFVVSWSPKPGDFSCIKPFEQWKKTWLVGLCRGLLYTTQVYRDYDKPL